MPCRVPAHHRRAGLPGTDPSARAATGVPWRGRRFACRARWVALPRPVRCRGGWVAAEASGRGWGVPPAGAGPVATPIGGRRAFPAYHTESAAGATRRPPLTCHPPEAAVPAPARAGRRAPRRAPRPAVPRASASSGASALGGHPVSCPARRPLGASSGASVPCGHRVSCPAVPSPGASFGDSALGGHRASRPALPQPSASFGDPALRRHPAPRRHPALRRHPATPQNTRAEHPGVAP